MILALMLAASLPSHAVPLVHGHRGCRARRPENTLPAFLEALRVGADVLELDLNVTKDGTLVVAHDPEVNPELCLGMDGKPAPKVPIRSLAIEEVRRLDCGSLKNPRFPLQRPAPGARMPTLDDVFALVAGSTLPAAGTIQFNIETKIEPGRPELSPSPEEFAKLVVDAVRARKLVDRVIVQSFDDRTLKAVKKLEPKLRLSLLTSDNHLDYVAAARSAGASILSPDAGWITKEDVDALHKAKIQVAPWTVDDEKGWDRMLALGVDAVISDDPEALRAYLRERASPR